MSSSPKQVPAAAAKLASRKLDSWKEIATYLGREVRTVQRWEKSAGLPVRRLYHEQRGSVYAFTAELDAWIESRQPEAPSLREVPPREVQPGRESRFHGAISAVAIAVAALALVLLAQRIEHHPIPLAKDAAVVPITPAREEYLRGLYFLNLQTPEGVAKAIAEFEKAAELNPRFAAPYARIAEAHAMMSFSTDRAPHATAAHDFAARALATDAASAEAHEAAGAVAAYVDWNWSAAESEYKKALALDPDLATAHDHYAQLAAILGREDFAIAEAQRAWQLQPLSPTFGASLGWYYYWARQYDRAVATSREVMQSQPGFYSARMCVIRALVAQGKFSDARDEVIRQWKAMNVDYRAAGLEAASPEDAIHNFFEWRLARLHEMEKSGEFPSFDLALTFAALGEKSQLIDCMERSLAQRQFVVLLLNVEPFFDRYRNEPRLLQVAQKAGLPPATPPANTVAALR